MESEFNSCSSSDHSLKKEGAKSNRGRPRMSKTSLVLSGGELRFNEAEFVFLKEEQYEAIVKDIFDDCLDSMPPKKSGEPFFQMAFDDQKRDKLLQKEGCSKEFFLSLLNRPKRNCPQWLLSKYTHLFEHNHYQANQECSRKPPRRGSLSKLKAIGLLLEADQKLSTIAAKTSLPLYTISRLKRSLIQGQLQLVNKLRSDLLPTKSISCSQLSKIRSSLVEPDLPLLNKHDLLKTVRAASPETSVYTDNKLFQIVKSSLRLKKRKPKLVKTPTRRRYGLESFFLADLSILKLFHCDNNLLIYDTCSFINDKANMMCWAVPGSRPSLPQGIGLKSLHLYLLISHEGIEAAALSKESVTTISTNRFLTMALAVMARERRNKELPAYILMDNSPANSRETTKHIYATFGVQTVFNVPANPFCNPIEALFGVIKQHYRKLTATVKYLDPKDVMGAIKKTGPEVVRRTFEYVKYRTLASLRQRANL